MTASSVGGLVSASRRIATKRQTDLAVCRINR